MNDQPTRHPWWKGRRGEWYVAAQGLLFALVAFGPRSASGLPPWPEPAAALATAAGIGLLVLGAAICAAAALHLGSNLTPLPHPRDDATLVTTGLYRYVRHPIYCGVLLLAFGWALFVQGWLTLAYAALLFAFFDLKSRREETWLMARFPDYADYRRRVRRLIPFLY
ncbi:methyltransferase family protein [Thauera sinica]|uniref:Methyltransferase family protein n=1 Tax=Thauera sinica TaxID=2665146 RepID=A0ABW1ANT1_9RHOO|nr:isoprenylcysteine carboxylmethyltransferase family protein [Thauera sp. K11]ATE62020.1 isoprenylcysteine carboxyl methyltransferase [Thauera sp. K11]